MGNTRMLLILILCGFLQACGGPKLLDVFQKFGCTATHNDTTADDSSEIGTDPRHG